MSVHLASSPPTAAQCMRWESYACTHGALRFALMHVTADPAGLASGSEDYRVLASTRLVLRGGAVYGASIAAPHSALPQVFQVLAGILDRHGYDECAFNHLDRELTVALQSADLGRVRATLDRGATMYPRPAVAASWLDRLLMPTASARSGGTYPAQPVAQPRAVDLRPLDRWQDDPAVARYRSVLDAHALAYQASAGRVCGVLLDRLAVYNFIAGTAGTARYRAQAVQAMPWLLPILVAPRPPGIPEEVERILAAIDGTSSLHAAVASAFGVPREVVRWLGPRDLPDSWQLDLQRLRRLLVALSWLPPEWRPQDTSQFLALTETCNILAGPLRFDADRGEHFLATRLARQGPCMRRWLADVSRPGRARAAMRGDRQQLCRDLSDASDFLRVLAQGVQGRYRLGSAQAGAVVLRWCARVGLRRLIDLSREWHEFTFTMTVVDSTGGDVLRWPAVLPRPWRHRQVTIVELTSSTQLIDEGRRMSHCVGMLGQACYLGHSIVVALHSEATGTGSTAELRFCDEVDLQVALEQHRSVRNGPPDPECEQALVALLRHLNDGYSAPQLRARRDFQRSQHARACEQAAEGYRQYELHAGQARELAWRLASQVRGIPSLGEQINEA